MQLIMAQILGSFQKIMSAAPELPPEITMKLRGWIGDGKSRIVMAHSILYGE
jgi:hypothetical protein